MNLQKRYNSIKRRLENLVLVKVGGKAGRLHSKGNCHPHYKAVFTFRPEQRQRLKMRRLGKSIQQKGIEYGVTIDFEEDYEIKGRPTGLSVLVIRAKEGKPYEQEETLTKALSYLEKDLKQFQNAN